MPRKKQKNSNSTAQSLRAQSKENTNVVVSIVEPGTSEVQQSSEELNLWYPTKTRHGPTNRTNRHPGGSKEVAGEEINTHNGFASL